MTQKKGNYKTEDDGKRTGIDDFPSRKGHGSPRKKKPSVQKDCLS